MAVGRKYLTRAGDYGEVAAQRCSETCCGSEWDTYRLVRQRGPRWVPLAEGFFDFAEPVGAFEDLAGFGSVGGTDDAVTLHEVDEVGGAAVADAQPAL